MWWLVVLGPNSLPLEFMSAWGHAVAGDNSGRLLWVLHIGAADVHKDCLPLWHAHMVSGEELDG